MLEMDAHYLQLQAPLLFVLLLRVAMFGGGDGSSDA
jgi:hypothetical protein